MELGILGGTFNPIHLGHLILAEEVREKLGVEKIMFIPSARPPHKDEKSVINPIHRLRMTQLATEENPFFEVSDIELKRSGKSYTIDTIGQIKEKFWGANIYFIIGGDSVLELDTWKKPEQIARECTLVGTTRAGFDLRQVRPYWRERVKFVRISDIEISGTELRKAIRKGESVRYKIHPKVADYIEKYKLYI